MRRLIQTVRHSQIGIYLQCFALLLLVAGVLMIVMGLQCQTRGCSSSSMTFKHTGLDLPLAYRADMKANGHFVDVWIEFGETGVFTPATTAQGTVITTDDGQTIPFLDDLAEKGYIAIRVPHAPPTYTLSSLRPGVLPYEPNAVRFSYYSPPATMTPTTVAVSVTRRLDLEGIVNAQFPIPPGDHSHWEVWWLPPGAKFPIPDQPFRLKAEGALALAFQIDFVDAPGKACAGCPVEVLAYNGYVFVGPYQAPLRLLDAAIHEPLVAFGTHCSVYVAELSPSVGQYISPTVPFTHVHCLENWDTITRTFTITTASSQGWNYTYYYQKATVGSAPVPAGSLPFVVTVPPPYLGLPGCLSLLAVYTPTIAVTDTLRETFTITATSTVSPEVRASAVSIALAPGYKLDEGGAQYRLYLPLVLKQ